MVSLEIRCRRRALLLATHPLDARARWGAKIALCALLRCVRDPLRLTEMTILRSSIGRDLSRRGSISDRSLSIRLRRAAGDPGADVPLVLSACLDALPCGTDKCSCPTKFVDAGTSGGRGGASRSVEVRCGVPSDGAPPTAGAGGAAARRAAR